MSAAFDAYEADYEHVVERSIAFSGLKHDFFVQAKLAVLARLFAERLGGAAPHLLDVGCGVGRMHDALAPLAASVAGTDLSEKAIERAQREHPWAEYRVSAADALPWPDAHFDCGLAVCVLHHVPRSGREALVSEMRRVTRPGGLVVIIEHNPWNPATRLAVARCPFDWDAVLLDARETRELLRRGSLRHLESRHFLLLPSRAPWAGSIEHALRRVPLGAQYAAVGEV